MTKFFKKPDYCYEDALKTKALIKNNYILKSSSKNLWITCNEGKRPAAPATAATPAKREDNQIAGESGSADVAPADADTAPGSDDAASANTGTEEKELSYEDMFGYPE
ncbi:hypothetical protein BGW39_009046 [Mortierella sp. 14UC]|nr:hypothetical protein BGW39_009046 [Mortierella sp. 14UC]